MALLAMTLMVGLVFYVYNLGDHANRRLGLQNAADAAAISGGDWMARSINLVALNNCTQVRMLALVPIFDAAPLASEIAAEEMTVWEYGLAQQLARGIPGELDFLAEGLEELRQRYQEQRDILVAFHATVGEPAYDMKQTTHWYASSSDGNLPHGDMWRTAVGLQEFSEVTIGSAGVLAQSNAVRFGLGNRVDVSFMLPVVPEIPAKPGSFEDFRPPLVGSLYWGADYEVVGDHVFFGEESATLTIPRVENYNLSRGGAIPDYEYFYRLGPWAALYKWRYPQTVRYGGNWVPGQSEPGPAILGSTSGKAPIHGQAPKSGATVGTSGHWAPPPTTVIVGYRTYGPYVKLMEAIASFCSSDLPDSGFYGAMYGLTLQKLKYMFYHLDYNMVPELTTFTHTDWRHVDSLPDARALAGNPLVEILQTRFYVLEIVSSIPREGAGFLTPGTFVTDSLSGEQDLAPIARTIPGWSDPDGWGLTRVARYIWTEEYGYGITFFPEIGIQPKPLAGGDEGDLEYQPVYVYAYYVWGGVDIGQDWEVRNPCNWTSWTDLPAPWLYDPADGYDDYDPDDTDPDYGARREFFAFLGVAQNDTRSRVWPSQFKHRNPLGAMAAVAQAKVFNNKSWDLWTQDWRVQLMPVKRWGHWVDRMDEDYWQLDVTDDLIEKEDYDSLYDYFNGIDEDMADDLFNH